MKVEYKKDWLGKYTKITTNDGKVFIERYFKELNMCIKVQEK